MVMPKSWAQADKLLGPQEGGVVVARSPYITLKREEDGDIGVYAEYTSGYVQESGGTYHAVRTKGLVITFLKNGTTRIEIEPCSPPYWYWWYTLETATKGMFVRGTRTSVLPAVLDGKHRTKSRYWKCRTCHGYTWQGDEVEATLAELAQLQWERWDYRVHKHEYKCHRCDGVGKVEYGLQPTPVPIHAGMILDEDGDPIGEVEDE